MRRFSFRLVDAVGCTLALAPAATSAAAQVTHTPQTSNTNVLLIAVSAVNDQLA